MLGRKQIGTAISLAPRLPADIATIYSWFDDPDFYPGRELRTYEQYFKRYEDDAEDADDVTLWTVIREPAPMSAVEGGDVSEGREIVGIASLVDFTGEGASMESMLYLIPSARGKGYGTEAVRLRARYGFEYLSLEVMQTTIDQENVAARRILEKAGYRRTGWRPHYTRRGGQWRDLDVYALTRDWWLDLA